MECHMLTILFALQLWDPESNPIWVFFSGITGWPRSRAEHPVLGEMGGHRLALGCFQHFPFLSDFTSLLLYAGELSKREKIQIFWGHLSFCRSQVKCEVTKGEGNAGSDLWKKLWKFPRKQKYDRLSLVSKKDGEGLHGRYKEKKEIIMKNGRKARALESTK